MTMHADADSEIRIYETIDKPRPNQPVKMAWKSQNETPEHVKNWLDSVKANKDPNSTIELGHQVITAAHLANLAYRKGIKVNWDAQKQQVVTG
jgi:hypothetical protein